MKLLTIFQSIVIFLYQCPWFIKFLNSKMFQCTLNYQKKKKKITLWMWERSKMILIECWENKDTKDLVEEADEEFLINQKRKIKKEKDQIIFKMLMSIADLMKMAMMNICIEKDKQKPWWKIKISLEIIKENTTLIFLIFIE